MKKSLLITIICLCLANIAVQQQCTLSDPEKVDCGYMGIDKTKCEAKGCCWKPRTNRGDEKNDIPWCFFPAG